MNRAPVITVQASVRSRSQKRATGANPHPPRLAPQETSDYSSQVLSAEKGALRTWGAGAAGHNSYKRSHVPAHRRPSSAVDSFAPPSSPELCTQCPHFHRHRGQLAKITQRGEVAELGFEPRYSGSILNSPWICIVP